MILSRRAVPWAFLAAAVALATSCRDVAAPAVVASVVIGADSAVIVVGGTVQLSVLVRDTKGAAISGPSVVWSTLDGNTVRLTSSGVVTGVSPGRAVITAASGGKSATIYVRVLAPLNYAIVGVQFTQAIQSADGSIPMVLGGNGAAVNVLMSSNAASTVPMQLVLRLYGATGGLVRADTALVLLAPGAATRFDSASAQFQLPPTALDPGLRWQLVRDPKHLSRDSVGDDDVFPRSGPAALQTVVVPPLRIRFVPIVLTAYGNVAGNVNAGNVAQYVRMLHSIYPLATIDASIGTPVSTAASFGTPPNGGDATQFWGPLLADLDAARITSADPSTHWIGVVLPPSEFNHERTGGIGYIPTSGTSSAAGTRTALVTSLGWASDDAFTRDGVAHELGHNFGRRHAPCGNPDNVDPSYPYIGGAAGLPGNDVRSWMDGLWPIAVSIPAASGDIMSYCTPMWVSDYTYRAILNFRGSTAALRSAALHAASATPEHVLIVRGTVSERDGVTLSPTFSIDAPPAGPELGGSYRLEGRGNDGRVLFSRDFTPASIDHAPGVGHFIFAIPVTPDEEASLATIEVRGPAGSARIDRAGALAAPALRAAATAAPPGGAGLVAVSCPDAAVRGILVRDATTGALLGTANDAATQVAVAPGTALTVACSDGVGSSSYRVIAR